jgi:hypothetical protein
VKKIVEYPLESGGYISIEIEEFEPESAISRAGRDERGIPEKAAITFEEALDKIKPAASTILKKFRDLSDKPSEVQVEFGLKMNASVGAIISSGGIEANFKVSLKWIKE